MIFPFFQHLFKPHRYMVTLLIVALNGGVFALLSPVYFSSQDEIEDLISDDQFVEAQAKIFAEMILEHPNHFAGPLASLAEGVQQGDRMPTQILGRLSLRNAEFMERAPAFAFKGDHVLYRTWKSEFERFAKLRAVHPNYSFGLSSLVPGLESYITYQFLHGGFAHLIVNMLMLLLVGSVLEPFIGGAWLLFVYLLCGVGAAIGFVGLNGATAVPLVGASGSIMGLFGVLVGFRWREPVRFVWLLPTSTYAGYVFLPVWVLAGYFVVSDLAGFLEVQSWLGAGVAHAAHLGGFAVGILAGALLRLFLKSGEDEMAPVGLKPWTPLMKPKR